MKTLLFKFLKRFVELKYRYKGFVYSYNAYVSNNRIVKIGGGNIFLGKNAQVNAGCFFLCMDNIHIGDNSAIAYNVSFLTSANPNYPYNRLSELYKPLHAPITIGRDCWVGANSIILPGITIGDNVVVAAGSVVTRNVPSNVMVAGNPAIIKKTISYK